jgi:hypothetical protein
MNIILGTIGKLLKLQLSDSIQYGLKPGIYYFNWIDANLRLSVIDENAIETWYMYIGDMVIPILNDSTLSVNFNGVANIGDLEEALSTISSALA